MLKPLEIRAPDHVITSRRIQFARAVAIRLS